ncbi:MAG: TIGR01777 family oxidoreductase [Candidatus Dojkabacteria bacterium]
MKKAVLFGATGLIGTELIQSLLKSDYSAVVVSRDKTKAENSNPWLNSNESKIRFLSSDDEVDIIQSINGADAVINLAGAGLFDKRWSKQYKEVLFDSRVDITKAIVGYISKAKEKPKVFISGSAVGYYGGTISDKVLDESSPSGFDFLAQLCTAWENEANKVKNSRVRVINLRTGIVFSKMGGALSKLLAGIKFKIGTYFKPGTQYLSWIHIEDLVSIIMTCISNKKVNGPINATAPKPLTYKKLSEDIFEVYQPLFTIPVPKILARLIIGESSTLLTTGQKVTPQKLLGLNFEFKYTEALQALHNLS